PFWIRQGYFLALYPEKYNLDTRGRAGGRGGVGECVMFALRGSAARRPAMPAAGLSSPVSASRRLRDLQGPFATLTAVAALLVLQRPALAGPTGGQVAAGSATISQSGSTTNVNQSSQSTIINWQTFSIAPKETINFNQPNSSAVALNRVIGNEQSIISG